MLNLLPLLREEKKHRLVYGLLISDFLFCFVLFFFQVKCNILLPHHHHSCLTPNSQAVSMGAKTSTHKKRGEISGFLKVANAVAGCGFDGDMNT